MMVNRAGGSKGCETCRQRKILCDNRLPTCERCEKAKLICPGSRPFRVKLYKPSDATHPNGRSVVRIGDRVVPKWSNASDEASRSALFATERHLPPDLDAVQIGFLACVINKPVIVDNNPQQYELWIHATIESDTTSVTRRAAAALGALYFLGRYDGTERDRARAATKYVGAIQALSANLRHEASCYDGSNIAAVLLLFFYEAAIGNSDWGWRDHHNGLIKLIQHYGPQRMQYWLLREHFILCRPTIVWHAFLIRKRTFLADIEWKTVPWARTTIPKTPISRLIEILADIPGLLQDHDIILGLPAQHLSRDWLLQRLLGLIRRFFEWRWWWESVPFELSCRVAEPCQALIRLGLRDHHLTNALWFTATDASDYAFNRGHEIVMYNAGLLVLFDLARQYLDRSSLASCLAGLQERTCDQPAIRNTAPLLPPESIRNTEQLMDEIYRTVPFLLHSSNAYSGSFVLFYPLWICEMRVAAPGTNSNAVMDSLWMRLRYAVQAGFKMREKRRVTTSGTVPET